MSGLTPLLLSIDRGFYYEDLRATPPILGNNNVNYFVENRVKKGASPCNLRRKMTIVNINKGALAL